MDMDRARGRVSLRLVVAVFFVCGRSFNSIPIGPVLELGCPRV